MRRRDAVKLHSGDEVIAKQDGRPCRVYSIAYNPADPKSEVIVKLQHPTEGYLELGHTEVR